MLQLCIEFGVARSTFYKWLKEIALPISSDSQKITMREINELRRKAQKYKNIIRIFQSVDCTLFSSTKEKLAESEPLYGQYEVHTLYEALDVPQGAFYNHVLRGKHGNTINNKRCEKLKILINDIFH